MKDNIQQTYSLVPLLVVCVCVCVCARVPCIIVDVYRTLVLLLGQPNHVQSGEAQTLSLGLVVHGHVHTANHKVPAPLHRKQWW